MPTRKSTRSKRRQKAASRVSGAQASKKKKDVTENTKEEQTSSKAEELLPKQERRKRKRTEESEDVEKTKKKAPKLHETASPATVTSTTTDFSQPPLAKSEIKIVSWNVASWKSILNKGFREYIEKENPDIICLQETKVDETAVDANCLPGYTAYFYSCRERPGYAGTALFTKIKPVSVTRGMGIEEHDTEGRFILAEFETFYLINTYVPNSGMKLKDLDYRMKWDAAFLKYLKSLDSKKPVIWCGDLNVAHEEIDLKNPTTNRRTAGFTDEERANFSKVLESGFVDTYRHFHPTETDCYTFWAYKFNARSKNIGWRLDYFVVSKRLLDKISQSYIRKYVMGSDHAPIVLHLQV
jgi:exodeoxyribonuclease III